LPGCLARRHRPVAIVAASSDALSNVGYADEPRCARPHLPGEVPRTSPGGRVRLDKGSASQPMPSADLSLIRQNLTLDGSAIVRFQRGIEACDQSGTVKRLAQEANCSGPHGLCLDALVREGRDENDRRAASLGEQTALQLNAADAGHLHVGDHARRIADVCGLQEFFGRCKRMDGEAERPHQPSHCRTNRFVVIDDRNHWNIPQVAHPWWYGRNKRLGIFSNHTDGRMRRQRYK